MHREVNLSTKGHTAIKRQSWFETQDVSEALTVQDDISWPTAGQPRHACLFS